MSADGSAPAALPHVSARKGPHWGVMLAGLAVVVPLLVVLGLGFGRDPHAVRSPLVGRPAPPFTLPVHRAETTTMSLESYRGKPVVVNFWATWCEPCRQEHGTLQMAAQRMGSNVQFLGVVYEDTPDKISAFLDRHGSGYPALIDEGGKTAIAYGVGGVPETFFIDAAGTIVSKYNGPLPPATLFERVRQLQEAK